VLGNNHKGEFFNSGCQNFNFTKKYDVIWIQWIIGHLTDKDFVEFLIKCKDALTENGHIIMKENVNCRGFVVDKEDFTIIRDEPYFQAIFDKAQLDIIYQQDLESWPDDLYRVVSYVLK